MKTHEIIPPSAEELNQLRRDASEGDPNAASFFRNSEDADAALTAWRNQQTPPSSG